MKPPPPAAVKGTDLFFVSSSICRDK